LREEKPYKLRKSEIEIDYSIFGQHSMRRGLKRKQFGDDVDVPSKAFHLSNQANDRIPPQSNFLNLDSTDYVDNQTDPQLLLSTALKFDSMDDVDNQTEPQLLSSTALKFESTDDVNQAEPQLLSSTAFDFDSTDDVDQAEPQIPSSTVFEFDSTDDDISLGPDDQLSKWYTDLQETCHYQTEKMRVFLSFMDNKSQINNQLEKSKLAQLRIAFTNLLAGKASEIKTDDIQKFLSTNAYFYLHLPWDNKMRDTTKGDGLCLYRSLYQLVNLHNMETRHRSQYSRILTANTNLSDKVSRDDFVLFLESILDGLQKFSFDSSKHHGGNFSSPRFYDEGSELEKYIKKLTDTLVVLKVEENDWDNFILERELWGDFQLVKMIPYLFSTTPNGIHSFHGSYFMANYPVVTKFFGEVQENDSFAYLSSSMQHRTNCILSNSPISLKMKYLKEDLRKPKMVFKDCHFFSIESEPYAVYEELLNSSISEISDKIFKFITTNPIPMQNIQKKPERSMETILYENRILRDTLNRINREAAEMEKKNADLEKELKLLRDPTSKINSNTISSPMNGCSSS